MVMVRIGAVFGWESAVTGWKIAVLIGGAAKLLYGVELSM